MQIVWENRLKDDVGNSCKVSVDCKDFQINEPKPFVKKWSKRWYSFKHNVAALRYEVAIGIRSGDIVWAAGPFPAGMKTDWMIFKDGLKKMLQPDERVEADSGYVAGDPEFCLTPKGIWHPAEKQDLRNRLRARQETVNTRLTNFQAMSNVWRHGTTRHAMAFRAILVMVQIQIENGNPLFEIKDYE